MCLLQNETLIIILSEQKIENTNIIEQIQNIVLFNTEFNKYINI